MKTYLNKKYIPQDNSYSRNLSNGNDRCFVRLAGIPYKMQPPEITTIKSEPFSVNITEYSYPTSCTFVLVETTSKETYFVMFHESGVISETNTKEDIFKRVQTKQADIISMT